MNFHQKNNNVKLVVCVYVGCKPLATIQVKRNASPASFPFILYYIYHSWMCTAHFSLFQSLIFPVFSFAVKLILYFIKKKNANSRYIRFIRSRSRESVCDWFLCLSREKNNTIIKRFTLHFFCHAQMIFVRFFY